jgi:hypothetical protein
MELVFIHGPAAAGKLTVARELRALTGLGVFHNQLVVDALTPVFEFGSPEFVKLREEMWLAVFREATRAGRSNDLYIRAGEDGARVVRARRGECRGG